METSDKRVITSDTAAQPTADSHEKDLLLGLGYTRETGELSSSVYKCPGAFAPTELVSWGKSHLEKSWKEGII